MSVTEPAAGPGIIRDFVTRLPGKPGVYRMIDAKGDVIYVGKARNLRNRVANYVRTGGHTSRIAAMIALTATMEFVTTTTEADALLLEANLIKKLKPRFNVVLRDDKSFSLYPDRARSPDSTTHQASRRPQPGRPLPWPVRVRRCCQPSD